MTPAEKRRLKLFNLTPEMYKKIYDHQGGACAMCGKHFDPEKLIICDHEHASGLVRGLLCMRCNAVIREYVTVAFARSVLAYLLDPPATIALGFPLYGLPGRVGTSMKRKRALDRKQKLLRADKDFVQKIQEASMVKV